MRQDLGNPLSGEDSDISPSKEAQREIKGPHIHQKPLMCPHCNSRPQSLMINIVTLT